MSVDTRAVMGYGYMVPYDYWSNLCKEDDSYKDDFEKIDIWEAYSLKQNEYSYQNDSDIFMGVIINITDEYDIIDIDEIKEFKQSYIDVLKKLNELFDVSNHTVDGDTMPHYYLIKNIW